MLHPCKLNVISLLFGHSYDFNLIQFLFADQNEGHHFNTWLEVAPVRNSIGFTIFRWTIK